MRYGLKNITYTSDFAHDVAFMLTNMTGDKHYAEQAYQGRWIVIRVTPEGKRVHA
jgi:hypothetical protein